MTHMISSVLFDRGGVTHVLLAADGRAEADRYSPGPLDLSSRGTPWHAA
jgi:hypothetical protein